MQSMENVRGDRAGDTPKVGLGLGLQPSGTPMAVESYSAD